MAKFGRTVADFLLLTFCLCCFYEPCLCGPISCYNLPPRCMEPPTDDSLKYVCLLLRNIDLCMPPYIRYAELNINTTTVCDKITEIKTSLPSEIISYIHPCSLFCQKYLTVCKYVYTVGVTKNLQHNEHKNGSSMNNSRSDLKDNINQSKISVLPLNTTNKSNYVTITANQSRISPLPKPSNIPTDTFTSKSNLLVNQTQKNLSYVATPPIMNTKESSNFSENTKDQKNSYTISNNDIISSENQHINNKTTTNNLVKSKIVDAMTSNIPVLKDQNNNNTTTTNNLVKSKIIDVVKNNISVLKDENRNNNSQNQPNITNGPVFEPISTRIPDTNTNNIPFTKDQNIKNTSNSQWNERTSFGEQKEQSDNSWNGDGKSYSDITVKKTQMNTAYNEAPSSAHFMGYFLTAIVLCIAGYIVFHNKQKIIAFIIEGRNQKRGRRPNANEYKKLQTNVDDVMISLDKSTTAQNYIY